MKVEHLELVPRVGQVVFCSVCAATSSVVAHAMQPSVPLGIWLAIVASTCGLLCSSFRIYVHYFSRKIAKAMPGFVDLLLSAALASALLSSGINIATVGICHAQNGTATITPRAALAAQSPAPGASIPTVMGKPHHVITNSSANLMQNSTADGKELQEQIVIPPVGAVYGRRRLLQHSHVSTSSSSSSFPAGSSRRSLDTMTIPRRSLLAHASPRHIRMPMLCSCWDATVTLCFLNFLLYIISGAGACLDIRLGKGLVVINKQAIVGKLFDHQEESSGHGRAAGSGSDSEFGDADVDIIVVPIEELVEQRGRVDLSDRLPEVNGRG